ncbi:ABC transporter ATP-binding protein [Sphingomonas sp.]|uniref:ABC transporter ATP-binding protein n=1 Tax=Sphingomonas sp. TaxID=28214 RepID=UPI00286FA9C0|nr:ABC transporter ATP-binding protein [Sphingomonas sp.]
MDMIVRNLTLRLGGLTVLSEIDTAFRPGRVTAILGPNGAGKSSLLKTLAGLVPPDAGTITLGDRPLADWPAQARARAIGYLPQSGAVHWNLRARDLVALGRLPDRRRFAGPSPADEAAITAALAATETLVLADRRVGDLSGGERARVLLARVLAGDPRWLLADEPLASLDPAHQIDLLERLRGMAVEGRGVAVVLHDIAQAARVADDVLLLRDGRLVAAGQAAAVLTPDTIAAVFDVTVACLPGACIMVPIGRIPSPVPPTV